MQHLNGKKILLFVPNGKGIYGSAISQELLRRGASVDIYDERPSTSTLSKVLLRIAKPQVSRLFFKYIDGIVFLNKGKEYDYILVVRGEGFDEKSMQLLKKNFPSARFILYLWDSLKNTNTKNIFEFFDKVLSFDKQDSQNNPGLIHRPLFFCPPYRVISKIVPNRYDVMFLGKVHSDRYSFIKQLEKKIIEQGRSTFFYFYFSSKFLFYQKRLTDASFRKTSIKDFEFKMLSANEVAEYMANTKCSLDIQHPLQTGLTMRTIEVLGAKRKLITTNEIIKSYDFYNENNICIVDRKNPVIDPAFIDSPYQEIDNDLYEYYSLEGWVDSIFEN